jgi:sugar/nucleoside kinase (ribokinase family)
MFGRGFAQMPDRNGLALLPESGGDWICTDGNHGSASIKAIEWAHDRGARAYVMDTLEGAPTRKSDICQTSPNWVDGPDSRGQMHDFAVEWAAQQGCLVLVTLGAGGVIAAMPGGQSWSIPAIECPEIIDSTGAGDAFRSGVLLGLEMGEPMDRCILLGLGAGSLACTNMGALRADRSRLESLLDEAPNQVNNALSAASGLAEAYNSAK